jgi:RimJ/RimL family protein N-acetyltransferase
MDAKARALLLSIPEEIETERMILRATRAEDVPAVFAAVLESVNELKPWMPWVHPEPKIDGSIEFHHAAQIKWRSREMLDFQWLDKSSGALIGKGGLHTINWEIPKFEIGYWVRTSMASHGYCTEAVNALIAFSKQHLGAKRLEICSDPRNGKSRRVAERCGFNLEGILRHNMRDPFGGLRDSCMYAMVFE